MMVIVAAALDIVDLSILGGLTSFAVIILPYFLWGLYRLRTACPVCFTTHANLLILVTIAGWRPG
jgi:hypothetical protein